MAILRRIIVVIAAVVMSMYLVAFIWRFQSGLSGVVSPWSMKAASELSHFSPTGRVVPFAGGFNDGCSIVKMDFLFYRCAGVSVYLKSERDMSGFMNKLSALSRLCRRSNIFSHNGSCVKAKVDIYVVDDSKPSVGRARRSVGSSIIYMAI